MNFIDADTILPEILLLKIFCRVTNIKYVVHYRIN